jgi:hypothetical protein
MKIRTFVLLVLAFSFTAIGGRAQQTPGLDTKSIDQTLMPGQMQGDVYRVGLPRTDLKVTVHGIAIKPGPCARSWAAFRRAGNQTVIHGDLVLLESEINPVISKLQDGGLQITALHNHLIDETPHLMYLHYWGQGTEAALGKALRAALETTKTPLMPPPPRPRHPRRRTSTPTRFSKCSARPAPCAAACWESRCLVQKKS